MGHVREVPVEQSISFCREKLGVMDKLIGLIYAKYDGRSEREQLLLDIHEFNLLKRILIGCSLPKPDGARVLSVPIMKALLKELKMKNRITDIAAELESSVERGSKVQVQNSYSI